MSKGLLLLVCATFVGFAFAQCDLTLPANLPSQGTYDAACVSPIADGANCTFTCSTDYTGGGAAVCTGTTLALPAVCLANCLAAPVQPSPTAGAETYAGTCAGSVSGATCVQTCATAHFTPASGAHATCSNGTWSFSGLCVADPNDCATSQCNGGVCGDSGNLYDGAYTCNCSALVPVKTGTRCTTQAPDCSQPTATNNGATLQAQPCLNGGTCQNGANTTDLVFSCQCPNFASGLHCETLIGDCANSASTNNGVANAQCVNGGTCVDGTANDLAFTCDCSTATGAGATGARCQTQKCPALSKPANGNFLTCATTAVQLSGATCVVTCDAGSSLVGAVSTATCNNGTWSALPTCRLDVTGCMDSSKCNYDGNANIAGTCYDDCATGQWSAWSFCDAECGQNGTQSRACLAAPGQRPCPAGPTTQSCVRQCCTECNNCSWWYGYFTPCTRKCGRFGRMWREIILDRPADPNAIVQCPPGIYQNVTCNNYMCRERIDGRGFWSWPVCGPANFTWTVGSLTGQDIDTFVFEDGFNYDAYRKDVGRLTKPLNYGYHAVAQDLATENAKGLAHLEEGKCYHFVVDYTNVGYNVDDDIQNRRPLIFTYELLGNPSDPLDGMPGEWGAGERSGASSLAPAFTLLFALFSVLAMLR